MELEIIVRRWYSCTFDYESVMEITGCITRIGGQGSTGHGKRNFVSSSGTIPSLPQFTIHYCPTSARCLSVYLVLRLLLPPCPQGIFTAYNSLHSGRTYSFT